MDIDIVEVVKSTTIAELVAVPPNDEEEHCIFGVGFAGALQPATWIQVQLAVYGVV